MKNLLPFENSLRTNVAESPETSLLIFTCNKRAINESRRLTKAKNHAVRSVETNFPRTINTKTIRRDTLSRGWASRGGRAGRND